MQRIRHGRTLVAFCFLLCSAINCITFRKNPVFSNLRFGRSIASGGIVVDVYGTGFSLLDRVHMAVVDGVRVLKGASCTIARDDLMHCFTPDLKIPHKR